VHVDAEQVSFVVPTPPVTTSELHDDGAEQLTVVVPSPPLTWLLPIQLLAPSHATSTANEVSPSTLRPLQLFPAWQVALQPSALPQVTVSLLHALVWH
jgi:hypothetical protein